MTSGSAVSGGSLDIFKKMNSRRTLRNQIGKEESPPPATLQALRSPARAGTMRTKGRARSGGLLDDFR
ncbi:hypothetical protein TNCV_106011 [Trichonephila clavipes]|nr:hypothetical protein TNCV_106011 [Trichonephila clavipes]